MSTKKNVLICVVGPTAIGKTALSIKLAKHFKTDIISCDSRQFFKEMKIGTAVPEEHELKAAPHHFIQNISIHQEYNVGQFEKDALQKLNSLFAKNSIQLMVGGSGLYVDAVIKGLDYFPKIDPEIRENLNVKLNEKGLAYLQDLLKKLDTTTYNTIALENPQRVIRALEICIGTGKAYSSFKNKKKQERNFNTIKIGLNADRPIIYDRINKRVDIMVKNGLIEEAKQLYPYKDLNALQTVGYKELFTYLDGKTTREFAIEEIKKNTRRFAKRQLTWFTKDKNTTWFNYTADQNKILEHINSEIGNF